jgi:hypothetical protein
MPRPLSTSRKVHLLQNRIYERAECGKPTLGLPVTQMLGEVTCRACLYRYRAWQKAWGAGREAAVPAGSP